VYKPDAIQSTLSKLPSLMAGTRYEKSIRCVTQKEMETTKLTLFVILNLKKKKEAHEKMVLAVSLNETRPTQPNLPLPHGPSTSTTLLNTQLNLH
jgi:hypothetical protein